MSVTYSWWGVQGWSLTVAATVSSEDSDVLTSRFWGRLRDRLASQGITGAS